MSAPEVDDEQTQFIQAFAVPTKLYRFLEEHRKKIPPLFLNRNLTYVNHKKWRPKKAKRRSSGKFNTLHSITDKLVKQKRGTKHYMTLTFSGLHCNELTNYRHAEIQVFHKQTSNKLATVIIDINPNEMLSGLSTISLPTEMLKITTPNGDLLDISSCILLFKVRVIDKVAQNRYLNRDELSIDNYKFESELELIDKGGDGLIVSDQYDLSFGCESDAELVTVPKPAAWKIKHFTKKSLSMTAIDDDEISEFLKPIRLMCDVQWSRDMCPNNENKENGENVNGSNGKRMFTRSRSTGSIISRRSFNTYKSNENIQCLVYQFNYKNYRQKTELWDRLKCPWCSLKSQNLYILLKHLTLCHGLFKFKYVPGANEIRIDVFLDKRPTEHRIDPFSRLATKFCDKEPHKRKVMTGVLVNRPQRSRPKLSEFLNFETNLKRTFYHSFTGIPLKACELDVNSEDEADPLWLRQNTVKMINEFSDVNDGEKCMMKQWNLFVMKHAFISDSQIPSAVLMFVKEHGEFIITNNLYRNFIVHLSNLFDYGLLTDKQHFGAVKALQATLLSNRSLVNLMRTRIIHMRKEDVTVGKPPIKPTKKRTVLNVQTGIKRRLRSNSIFIEPVKKTKIRRTEAKKINMPTTLSPRPVRKLARVTM